MFTKILERSGVWKLVSNSHIIGVKHCCASCPLSKLTGLFYFQYLGEGSECHDCRDVPVC